MALVHLSSLENQSTNWQISQNSNSKYWNLLLVGTVRRHVIQLVRNLRRFFPTPRQNLLNPASDRCTLQPATQHASLTISAPHLLTSSHTITVTWSSHSIIPLHNLHLASSKQWCWSRERGILTELSLCYSIVYCVAFQQCTLHNHNEQFFQVDLLDRLWSHWA